MGRVPKVRKVRGEGGMRQKGGPELRWCVRISCFFLAWWGLGAWLSYTYAGEKMPWLTTHMAQPMALFGGWWGGRDFKKD